MITEEFDDHMAVMDQGRHDAVGIEREIFGPELVAGEQVEAPLGERDALGVQHEAHALAAGRLRAL